jgi:hypothetical protein
MRRRLESIQGCTRLIAPPIDAASTTRLPSSLLRFAAAADENTPRGRLISGGKVMSDIRRSANRIVRALVVSLVALAAASSGSRDRRRHDQRLFDLARKLGAPDVRGVRERRPASRSTSSAFRRRGARARHRREEQSARRRAVRRPVETFAPASAKACSSRTSRRVRRAAARFKHADGHGSPSPTIRSCS